MVSPEILHRASWLPNDVMARRWADLSDSEASDQLDELIGADSEGSDDHDELTVATVRVEDGGSVYVAMQPRDTVGDLNLWIEKTQGLLRNSFALSHNGEYLTRRRPMATLAPACVLHLTSRVEDGRPRGMPLLRCNSRAKTKDAIYITEEARGDPLEFPHATRALSADPWSQRCLFGPVGNGKDNNSHRDASRAVQWNI